MAFEKFPERISGFGVECEVKMPRPGSPRHYVIICGSPITSPHELTDLAKWCTDAAEFLFDEMASVDSPVRHAVAALLEKETKGE